MGALSKIEAVNRILRAAGEFPVSTLNSTSNDSLLAASVLEEQTLYANMEGSLQNTIYTEITATEDGQFVLPDSLLHIETVGPDAGILVSTRGNNPTLLYDVVNNSTTWTNITKLSTQQVIRLEFEDLPTQQQFAVTDHASRIYQMQTVGDVNQDNLLIQQQMASEARSKQADARSRKANFLFGRNSNPFKDRIAGTGLGYPGGYNPRLGD